MSVHNERMVSEKTLKALCDIACTAAYQIGQCPFARTHTQTSACISSLLFFKKYFNIVLFHCRFSDERKTKL